MVFNSERHSHQTDAHLKLGSVYLRILSIHWFFIPRSSGYLVEGNISCRVTAARGRHAVAAQQSCFDLPLDIVGTSSKFYWQTVFI